jgi:hypothetical protein
MATVQPPPMPRSKRRNSVLRLYDGPLYRDWAFWLTAGSAVLAAVSMPAGRASSPTPSTTPIWFDVPMGILLLGGTFGVLPAWLRLLVRRWRWRRGERKASPSGRMEQPTLMPHHVRPAGTPTTVPPLASFVPHPSSGGQTPPPIPYQAPMPRVTIADRPSAEGAHQSPDGGLAAARKLFQHPIARAVRSLELAHSPREKYEGVVIAAESLAITLSVTAAALLNNKAVGESGDPAVAAARDALAGLKRAYAGSGAMFGTWTGWLASLRSLANAHPMLIPGLQEALEQPKGLSVLDDLNVLREERNRAAHGNRPHAVQEAALRVAALEPHLTAALWKARFLEDLPWLLTVSCSYQPRSNLFSVVTRRVMGDHPDFENQTFSWTQPVANDMFYVLGPGGPVMLSPFVASRFCSHCQQVEVCYAYKIDRRHGPATFKSFDSGHDIPADELGDDLRALPDRDRNR